MIPCQLTRVLFVTALVVAAAPYVMAERLVQTQAEGLEAKVRTKIVTERAFRAVTFVVDGDVVTLNGIVGSIGVKDDLIATVLEVDGVGSILSNVEIFEAESDVKLGEQIAAFIRRYEYHSVFDNINLTVENGVVILSGEVTEPFKKDGIEKAVSYVGGVRLVENRIEVLPVSGTDDRIREDIALRIYNDPLFSKYQAGNRPPIHIIVKRGRVRLTGVVLSPVERAFAGTIARQVFGVRSFRNELTVESER